MPAHPIDSWHDGMNRDQLLTWAMAHASWSEGAWARGDVQTWSSAFADDVIARVRRRMGPERFRGLADLIETAWGLHDFFPHESVEVIDVQPPAVVLYRIEMRDEAGNVVGIYMVHRVDGSGRVAEFVVHDDDASLTDVRAEMARLGEHGRSERHCDDGSG
jgi:hypothetical protein